MFLQHEGFSSDGTLMQFDALNQKQELQGDEKFCTYMDHSSARGRSLKWLQKLCMEHGDLGSQTLSEKRKINCFFQCILTSICINIL